MSVAIPSDTSPPKNIVICADGTWNAVQMKDRATGQPVATNVAKLASVLDRVDGAGRPQLLYYMQGVGTNEGESIEGGAFGLGLSENIVRAYEFIVKNYNPGDRLYFFGFSRGAFTVRSLGGMIRTAGIVRRESPATVSDAMELYAMKQFEADPDLPRARIFRGMHSHPPGAGLDCPPIECIGVWDTVGSMGIPTLTPRLQRFLGASWSFHDVTLGQHVRNAFHALAINERRSTFVPTLWLKRKGDAGQPAQNLVQNWFAGVHSDVGGGYPLTGNDKTHLSDYPLNWMIEMVNGTLKDGPGAEHSDRGEKYRGLSDTALGFISGWKEVLGTVALSPERAPHVSSTGIWGLVDWIMKKPGGHVRKYNQETGDHVKLLRTRKENEGREWESVEYIHRSARQCFQWKETRAGIAAGTIKWDQSFQ